MPYLEGFTVRRGVHEPGPQECLVKGGTEKQILAEARCILRARIKHSTWHAGSLPDERKRRIKTDVDSWCFLEVGEAARPLLDHLESAG